MAIFLDSAKATVATASSSWTVNVPTSAGALAEGDLILFQFAYAVSDATAVTTSTPDGLFTVIPYTTANVSTSYVGGALYGKFITAAEAASPPASWTFTKSASLEGSVVAARYRDVSTVDVLAVSDPATGYAIKIETSAVSTKTAPAVTTDSDNALVFGGMVHRSGSHTLAISTSGWSVAGNTGGDGGRGTIMGVRDAVQATPGTTGTVSFTSSVGAVGWSYQAALRDLTVTVPTYTLTVNVVGNGYVAQSPTSLTYEEGTVVNLAAVAQDRWALDAWSGAATGSAIETTVTMDADKTVTATFVQVTADPPAETLPASGAVAASGETQQFSSGTGDIADDPAFWVHPTDTSLSLVLGTKKTDVDGGVGVYSLDGTEHQFLAVGKVNNIDGRQGVFGGVDLFVTTNRTDNTLTFLRMDSSRVLSIVGSIATGYEPYGCAMYVSPVDGDVYAFVCQEDNASQSTNLAMDQYRLSWNGTAVSGALVRSMTTATLSEGMVCDDESGFLFLGEEDAGLYRYNAEPGGGTDRVQIDAVGAGNLVADVEGLAIARHPNGGPGYLVASSQGDSTFHVYDLDPPHAHRKWYTISAGSADGATQTDGHDVRRIDFGPLYPDGLVVAHDNDNTGGTASNFKLVDAALVYGALAEAPGTGTAAGSTAWVGAATGASARSGTGSGTTAWSGSATGQAPSEGTRSGSGAGETAWHGSATGYRSSEGSAQGVTSWVGATRAPVTRYLFTPPGRLERVLSRHPLFGRMTITRGVTLLKEGGIYRQTEDPSAEEVEAADAVYLGGRVAVVDRAVAEELTAAGYGEWVSEPT